MSAAATAAGYLYASGRLRGRGKDGEDAERNERVERGERGERPQGKRKPIRIAALPDPAEYQQPAPRKDKPAVKVAYRTRRWRPDDAG
jgi:hypothetical protein